jgi:hypothetical protein
MLPHATGTEAIHNEMEEGLIRALEGGAAPMRA